MNILIKIQVFFDLFFKTLASMAKALLLSDYSIWGKFKKPNTNSDLIILGNGPSLTESIEKYSEVINNNDAFVVNYFANTKFYSTLQPKYYCISAPEMLIDAPAKPILEKSNSLFKKIAEDTNWSLTLFLLADAKKSDRWKSIILKNKNITIIYYNNNPFEGLKSVNYFSWRHNIGLPRPHNVLIPSLIIGINLSYKKIYVFGADHSWLEEIMVDDDNNALLNQKHFYDKDVSVHKTMRKGYDEKRKLHEILHKFYLTFQGYHDIRKFAEKHDVTIFNATQGSYIDAFPRKRPL